MFLSKWSVQRPIAMSALIIVLVMIGASLYPKLSIDLLPNMEIPTVLVRCEYQGASPSEIEVEVVKRIEDAVSSLDGIKHVTSLAMEDEARIQLEFNMGTDVDIAATDIREAINRIRDDFPDGANEPMIRKIDAAMLDSNTVRLNAVVCCQNPSLNPMQLVAAIELYLPECKPDHAVCCRNNLFDNNEKLFR